MGQPHSAFSWTYVKFHAIENESSENTQRQTLWPPCKQCSMAYLQFQNTTKCNIIKTKHKCIFKKNMYLPIYQVVTTPNTMEAFQVICFVQLHNKLEIYLSLPSSLATYSAEKWTLDHARARATPRAEQILIVWLAIHFPVSGRKRATNGNFAVEARKTVQVPHAP